MKITLSGSCAECGCKVWPENVGFECDDFIVCYNCNERIKQDWNEFKKSGDFLQELRNGKPLSKLIN